MICPLDIDTAKTLELADYNCKIDTQTELSGVLILKDGAIYIE